MKDNNPVITVMDLNYLIKPIEVTFKTSQGNIFNVTINYKRTVDFLLMAYLDEIYHSELIDRNDKIQFLYKSQNLKFGDKTIVGELFLNDKNPLIIVMDISNFLSNNSLTKMNIIFSFHGIYQNVVFNFGTTMKQLIRKYLFKFDNKELIDSYYANKNSIKFIRNGQIIEFKEQMPIEKHFIEGDLIIVNLN